MKRTQLKDALRNIWKQKVSFLSIVVIAALGVTMFLGIDFSASAVRENASSFYNEKNFRDVELVSTLLLSENDLNAILSTDGVIDAEGVYLTDAKASANDKRTNVEVLSLTERINLPVLYEGRLPSSDKECAVERSAAEALNISLGDTVTIANAKGGTAQYLKDKEFVVSGIIVHPDHICSSVPATPYIMVVPEAFDAEQLDGCMMKAVIRTDRALDASRFDQAYFTSADTVLARLEDLGSVRTAVRDAEVKGMLADYRARLTAAEQELLDARAELDKGYADLADGERQYADGEQELIRARAELDDAKSQLADAERELEDARAELDAAKAELDAGKAELDTAKEQLDSARRQLVSGWNLLEDAKAEIRSALRGAVERAFGSAAANAVHWADRISANPDSQSAAASVLWITDDLRIVLDPSKTLRALIEEFAQSDRIPDRLLQAVFAYAYPDEEYDEQAARRYLADTVGAALEPYEANYVQLVNACSQWDRGHSDYLNGKAQYNEGLAQYEEGLRAYNDGEAQYAEGLRKYEDALAEYLDGEAQYEQGVRDLEDAREQLDDAMEKLSDGEAQYADGLRQYEEGKAELDDTEERIASLGPCKWIALDASGNASFSQLETAGSNLKSMEMTFSMLFVLVGALVIYATISKMVDEQRSLVGTTKALGFFDREIFIKYLMFGVTATVLGTVLGSILGATVIQGFALNGYNPYFDIDLSRHTVKLLPTVLVFLAGVLLAAAAIWFAVRKLFRESAIKLMQQPVPKGAKNTFFLKKQLLSLYSRLIILNIRADLKRVLVTVVSVAGCCALVVIGITLRQAVTGAETKHFSGIIRHDGMVLFDPESNAGAAEAIEERITAEGAECVPVMHAYVTVRFKSIDLQELYCGDLSAISEMYALSDAKTGAPIEPTDDGIYITKRFSENNGVKAGDTFELSLNGTETVEVRVAGVFDSYMNRYLFMSSEYFKALFVRDPKPNAFYVRLNGADSETLSSSLRSVEGFTSYEASDSARALFRSATSVLNGIVFLFIGMAGIMAGVVLMNLTNIYIMQKKRELTIMRINGFTVKEVIVYVLRETFLTTAAGILLGLAFGSWMGYKIVRSMEQSFMQFDRSVSLLAWLIGAAITIAFTVIVNAIALRKVRHLKLTDV